MGIYDRDYAREPDGGMYGRQVQITLPPMTHVVKWLLIINIVVFVVSYMIPAIGNLFLLWFSVLPETVGMSLQIWRLITYQFLHGGFWHVIWNMLILYFFGPMLEGQWGGRKFLVFYLICGAMGGVLYTLLVFAGILKVGFLIGASGAIYGLLAAGAILHPNMQVYFWGIFPIRLYVLAIIFACLNFMSVTGSANAGGEAAHLAGMAAGAVYVLWPRWKKYAAKRPRRTFTWESDINRQRAFQAEIDRILDKVHSHGITSLTRKEKKMLREASRRRQRGI
ncbi:MAG TPA: rhomboid family intramembrane serine protease [Planctomycetes bacterium]|nr:rhomboid family intramembrane serine protease [Planctomycetota bacterium]HIJ70073.1 rhomboid family intramembrane serine protease [Planctomycetota bacterium]